VAKRYGKPSIGIHQGGGVKLHCNNLPK
jgi:hypothetical protein